MNSGIDQPGVEGGRNWRDTGLAMRCAEGNRRAGLVHKHMRSYEQHFKSLDFFLLFLSFSKMLCQIFAILEGPTG